MYSADAYADALQQLLPPGEALPRGDSFLRDLLDALAQEFARVESAALNLFDELDPRTTLQLLPDWERVLGLPDDCTGVLGTTIPERRAAILVKLAYLGDQSVGGFVQMAAMLGYFIRIHKLKVLRAGFHAGHHCGDEYAAFAWSVEVLAIADVPGGIPGSQVPGVTLTFRAGGSRAGERIRSFAVPSIACAISNAAQAHTTPIFSYPTTPAPVWSYDFTQGV